MAYKAPRVQPQFADLLTSLNASRNQIKDNALYQTLYILIQRLIQSRDDIIKQIEDININVTSITNATYLTVNNELATLPNSRRELAGTNVTFDDTVPGIRTINVTGGGGGTSSGGNTPYLFSVYEEPDFPAPIEFLGNFPIASNNTPVSQNGYWTPLTDGNIDETDLIFANGEAIAVFVPV